MHNLTERHVVLVHPDKSMDGIFLLLESKSKQSVTLVTFTPSLRWKYPISIINFSMCQLLTEKPVCAELISFNELLPHHADWGLMRNQNEKLFIHYELDDVDIFSSFMNILHSQDNNQVSKIVFAPITQQTLLDASISPMEIISKYRHLYEEIRNVWK